MSTSPANVLSDANPANSTSLQFVSQDAAITGPFSAAAHSITIGSPGTREKVLQGSEGITTSQAASDINIPHIIANDTTGPDSVANVPAGSDASAGVPVDPADDAENIKQATIKLVTAMTDVTDKSERFFLPYCFCVLRVIPNISDPVEMFQCACLIGGALHSQHRETHGGSSYVHLVLARVPSLPHLQRYFEHFKDCVLAHNTCEICPHHPDYSKMCPQTYVRYVAAVYFCMPIVRAACNDLCTTLGEIYKDEENFRVAGESLRRALSDNTLPADCVPPRNQLGLLVRIYFYILYPIEGSYFNMMHSHFLEDGQVQRLFETLVGPAVAEGFTEVYADLKTFPGGRYNAELEYSSMLFFEPHYPPYADYTNEEADSLVTLLLPNPACIDMADRLYQKSPVVRYPLDRNPPPRSQQLQLQPCPDVPLLQAAVARVNNSLHGMDEFCLCDELYDSLCRYNKLITAATESSDSDAESASPDDDDDALPPKRKKAEA